MSEYEKFEDYFIKNKGGRMDVLSHTFNDEVGFKVDPLEKRS